MQNISTSLTAFLKYFVPTIWIIFFGTLLVAFWLNTDMNVGPFSPDVFKWVYSGFFLCGVALLYLMVMTIKRVEVDSNFVYATNYHKIYKYPFSNIKKVKELDYGLFKTVKIHLKEPGHFGKKVVFVASRRKYNAFFKENPAIAQQFKTPK